jgi:hypothetical protein
MTTKNDSSPSRAQNLAYEALWRRLLGGRQKGDRQQEQADNDGPWSAASSATPSQVDIIKANSDESSEKRDDSSMTMLGEHGQDTKR